jgi:hypothetical protein
MDLSTLFIVLDVVVVVLAAVVIYAAANGIELDISSYLHRRHK